jgi:type I restriction enzyme S subunit
VSNKYDNYKDSGVEWIGEIPSHWDIILFKRIIHKIKDGTHGSFQRVSEGKPFLSAKNVYDDGVRINETESFISEEDYSSIVKNGFPKKGDLLITCVGTIGRTFVYDFDEFLAFQRSVTFIRFNEDIIPQFYKYYVQSSIFQNLLMSIAKTSAQSGIYMGDLVNTITIKVPTTEQTSIANFLDHKTAQIDHLIAKKEQFIKLLEEERVAVINQAVTKGLDPNVPMKDSGVEWLGEIPEHWEVKRLGFVFKSLNTKRIPLSAEERGLMTDRVYDYYGASGIIDKVQDYLFEEDLILIGEDGANLLTRSKRLVFIASGKYWVNNHAHIIKPINGDINYYCEFLELIDYTIYITGSAQPKLTQEALMSIKIVEPPLIEQKEIYEFIRLQTSDLDSIITKSKQEIELLKEYKTALISEVVTGKVDVRNEILN